MKRPHTENRSEAAVALYRPADAGLAALGLACTGFGQQESRGWVRERVLDEFAAVFVQDGEGELITPAAGRLPIAAPALFWLHPGIAHSYGPAPGTGWRERWALFGGTAAEALLQAGGIEPRRPVSVIGNPAEIAGLFATLHGDFRDDYRLAPLAAAATLQRLIARSGRHRRPAAVRPRRGDIEAAVAVLRERAFGPVDLTALAAEFGFSPASFRRRMHEVHGSAPKALLMQWRCARAKELLATTGLSIEAVAARVGFEDPYYFSRVFAAREGLAPSAFRRHHRRS
jgi:AraC-like DNA-binding protein